MSAEFIKMISELHEERFDVNLANMKRNRTPCGIFAGFNFNPKNIAANIQMLVIMNLSFGTTK